MTLNNLAGGIAGGVAGVGPFLAGTAALIASFLMMAVGYVLGARAHALLDGHLDVRLLSCAIFAFLAFAQVEEPLSQVLRTVWRSVVEHAAANGCRVCPSVSGMRDHRPFALLVASGPEAVLPVVRTAPTLGTGRPPVRGGTVTTGAASVAVRTLRRTRHVAT